MVLKTIGTYNAFWMSAVWEAHLIAKRQGRRQQVRLVPTYIGYPALTWYPSVRPSRRDAPAR